ncbi:hypothetical protein DACRYDRAFT_13164 [Dacryopinax primogenitus]|uniref:Uncharacterized protein n=1 Tax=Dacryopinax primogenitus (strain DJM 731) TaxID=1858805 RepID=M5GD02_DACPD|nr:uncharacterized protein DACRYDRAFT_13164 [Dacryopinax primogenitus]EJU06535.1 hypothetical protein DACRYDRAFT_13164 [Dacryopinax primogenitus]
MTSYDSSSSLSVSPTAFSVLSATTTTATILPNVPHGFVRFKNNIKEMEQLSLEELKSRLATTEATLTTAHFSPHVMQKMFEKAESLRLRISELEANTLGDTFRSAHITSPSSSPPAFDPTARVIMRTRAMAVARPIISRGGTQGITFAESKPLETMAWEVQKEYEKIVEEDRERRRLQMEEQGVTEETVKFRKMEADGTIGRPAVREQTQEDKMWAFMNYKGVQEELVDEEYDEPLFQFDDDDDDWPENVTSGGLESIRSAAILPGSEEYYPPDPSGYQYGNDTVKWLST